MTGLLDLPDDVLRETFQNLGEHGWAIPLRFRFQRDNKTLNSLMQTCRRLHTLVGSILYYEIEVTIFCKEKVEEDYGEY